MEIQNIDFSALLNMIDTFYNNAWNRLIIVLAIVGVLWPLILKAYSDYQVRSKEEKLEKKLSDKIQKLNESNLELMNKENDANMKKLDDHLIEKINYIEKKLSAASGCAYHLQGNIYLDKKFYGLALETYFDAFDFYFDGKDELNLQTILKLIEECYEKITDLTILKEMEKRHLELIERLKEINENSRYSISIRHIKKIFSDAKKRLKISAQKG